MYNPHYRWRLGELPSKYVECIQIAAAIKPSWPGLAARFVYII